MAAYVVPGKPVFCGGINWSQIFLPLNIISSGAALYPRSTEMFYFPGELIVRVAVFPFGLMTFVLDRSL